ncbi:glycosyltransferase family 4 protein [Lacrimispora sp.]|uniref:glycosyltransferase family 4 protein n=1 Tax=Lacrimispora sp. TaxID=2719234 RepID=UPI003992526F
MKRKVCFVVQRYGLEVNGGAELHCRQIAEHIKESVELEVITTKAIDYMSWKDEYVHKLEYINGVMVRRFSVKCQRNQKEFDEINGRFLYQGLTEDEEKDWMEKQGPLVPDLLNYIIENRNKYDVFVFFTYLYYQTIFGLEFVKDKAILVPDAHDEPFLKMNIVNRLFQSPRAIFYNTIEEKKLVNEKFKNSNIKSDIGGAGIEIPNKVDSKQFKDKYQLDEYIIYVGRIDEGKNCHELFCYFNEYKKRNLNNVKLVLMGKSVINVPEREDILDLGYVSDEEKFNGISGAKLLILPSKFESLSIVVLEAMALGIPVLVNEWCDVLKGHCIKSNAGLYYNNYFEFEGSLNFLLKHSEIARNMGINGRKYVADNYQWNIIISKLTKLINYISELNEHSTERE